MFGYMTELDTVQEATSLTIQVEGKSARCGILRDVVPASVSAMPHPFTSGHDLESLLFNFLDEFLFNFSAEPFFVPMVSSNLLPIFKKSFCSFRE
jgi:SHS2 domain-containing protein